MAPAESSRLNANPVSPECPATSAGRVCDRNHLISGQTSAVKARCGVGGDAAGLWQSPPGYKGRTRGKHGENKRASRNRLPCPWLVTGFSGSSEKFEPGMLCCALLIHPGRDSCVRSLLPAVPHPRSEALSPVQSRHCQPAGSVLVACVSLVFRLYSACIPLVFRQYFPGVTRPRCLPIPTRRSAWRTPQPSTIETLPRPKRLRRSCGANPPFSLPRACNSNRFPPRRKLPGWQDSLSPRKNPP
jgi:hypothetical protein